MLPDLDLRVCVKQKANKEEQATASFALSALSSLAFRSYYRLFIAVLSFDGVLVQRHTTTAVFFELTP